MKNNQQNKKCLNIICIHIVGLFISNSLHWSVVRHVINSRDTCKIQVIVEHTHSKFLTGINALKFVGNDQSLYRFVKGKLQMEGTIYFYWKFFPDMILF